MLTYTVHLNLGIWECLIQGNVSTQHGFPLMVHSRNVSRILTKGKYCQGASYYMYTAGTAVLVLWLMIFYRTKFTT